MNMINYSDRIGKKLTRIRLAGWVILLALVAGPVGAATNVVRMVNFAFQPQFLTNHVGDTVLWTNTTTSFHDVVSSNNAWTASAQFPAPGTFPVTFNTPGVYGYYCSPHHSFGMVGMVVVQAAANQPPIVALTNPPAGRVLAAPATIVLGASASDPDGTIASVQFFSGTTNLGTAATIPYAMTVNNLTAGTYNFTASAQDNGGLRTTSTVVSVSVVTPGVSHFDTNLAPVGGLLRLRLNVTPGLSYAIDYTSTFTGWTPWTNFLATNAVMAFSAPTTATNRRFFRSRLLPNP